MNICCQLAGKIMIIISYINKNISSRLQGDWTGYNQLSFRLVQGAWCLAAFVLFNAYCSTLISYLISPRLMPMAKSYDDLASGKPQKLKLATEKNEIMATLFLVNIFCYLSKCAIENSSIICSSNRF